MPSADIQPEAGPSTPRKDTPNESGSELEETLNSVNGGEDVEEDESEHSDGMDPEGFSGPSEKTVKPLTPEALAAFNAAQERAGVVYISRIPPGMRPTKVRHLMSQYGEIGRVYLQQEGVFIQNIFRSSP